jgi:cell division protease FtsH
VTVLPRPASGPVPAGVSDASQHALDDEVRRIVERSHTDVLTLLRENRDRLDALANALLEHETLGEDEACTRLQAFPSRARRQESSQPLRSLRHRPPHKA